MKCISVFVSPIMREITYGVQVGERETGTKNCIMAIYCRFLHYPVLRQGKEAGETIDPNKSLSLLDSLFGR